MGFPPPLGCKWGGFASSLPSVTMHLILCVCMCDVYICSCGGGVSICTCMHTPVCGCHRAHQVLSSLISTLLFDTGFENLSLQIWLGLFIHELQEPVCFCHPHTPAQGWQMSAATLTFILYVPRIQTQSYACVISTLPNAPSLSPWLQTLAHGYYCFCSHFFGITTKRYEYVSQAFVILHRFILPWSAPVDFLHINTASKGYFIS